MGSERTGEGEGEGEGEREGEGEGEGAGCSHLCLQPAHVGSGTLWSRGHLHLLSDLVPCKVVSAVPGALMCYCSQRHSKGKPKPFFWNAFGKRTFHDTEPELTVLKMK